MRPDGWRDGVLGDLAMNVTDKANPSSTDERPYVALEHMAPGEPRLLGWSLAREATSTKTVFRTGDVLYGKLRPNLDKAILAPFDGVCSTDVLALRPAPGVEPRFLLEALHSPSFVAHAVSTASGTKMPRTGWALIAGFALAVPPHSEQRKIAAILSAMDDVIEKTEAVIESLQTLKKAMMKELLTRGLPRRHTRFKETEIGEIPEEWDVVELQSLCSNIVDCLHSTPAYVDGGPCFAIRTADVVPGKLLLERAFRVTEATYEARIERLSPLPGDVFYSREGERFGIAAPVPDGARVCLAQRMMHLRAGTNVSSSGRVCQVVEKFSRVSIRRDDVTTLPFSPPSDLDSHQARAV